MLDFEQGLQKSKIKIFGGAKIRRYKDREVSKSLLFLLKLLPYLSYDNRNEIFDKIENFYTGKEKYAIMIKY